MSMNPEERISPIEKHPVADRLRADGFPDSVVDRTMLVYLQLIEIQHWFDVDVASFHEKDEKLCFINGRRKKEASDVLFVLPVAATEDMDPQRMNHLLTMASKCGSTSNSLILAIVDTSSTILFYEIGSGLVEPRIPSHKEVEQMKCVPVWNEQKGKWKMF